MTGLVANTALGWWWLDGVVALLIAGWALVDAPAFQRTIRAAPAG